MSHEPLMAQNIINCIIAANRIPHALIIEGDPQMTANIAERLAAACICEGEQKPCGSCKGCHLAAIGNHTDIISVHPEDGKKSISVSKIREIRNEAFIKPRLNDRKVFIIHSAHKMTEQAQNALLKVLEEPPQNVVFILLTASRTMLLQTVISRCVPISVFSEASKEKSAEKRAAEEYIENLFAKKEYEMLKILHKYEKNRPATEEFFLNLKLTACEQLRENHSVKAKAAVLDGLYRQCDEYLTLLKTNINLSLLFSAATARAIRLTK